MAYLTVFHFQRETTYYKKHSLNMLLMGISDPFTDFAYSQSSPTNQMNSIRSRAHLTRCKLCLDKTELFTRQKGWFPEHVLYIQSQTCFKLCPRTVLTWHEHRKCDYRDRFQFLQENLLLEYYFISIIQICYT